MVQSLIGLARDSLHEEELVRIYALEQPFLSLSFENENEVRVKAPDLMRRWAVYSKMPEGQFTGPKANLANSRILHYGDFLSGSISYDYLRQALRTSKRIKSDGEYARVEKYKTDLPLAA